MKIRMGFVSNSSSTSFTVAFVPEETNLNLKTFEFLLGAHGNTTPVNLKVFKDTAESRRIALGEELKTIERDKTWLQDRIDKLIECSQIPAIQLLMNELDAPYKLDGDLIRYRRRQDKKEKWSDSIISRVSEYQNLIRNIDLRMVEITKQLALIKDLPGETMIARWEDVNGAQHMLSDLLKMLESDGRVIILEEHTT